MSVEQIATDITAAACCVIVVSFAALIALMVYAVWRNIR